MKNQDPKELAKLIGAVRCRFLCGYSGINFCDCKYGTKDFNDRNGSEVTGCPEFRWVEALLNNITKEEFDDITSR